MVRMKLPKSINVFRLAMINLAAIVSIRNWPLIAEYGFSSVFFFLLSALIFFVPISLISAELATGWPKIGGVFAWTKEAFGQRWGFLTIWLLWIENAFWYPTILSFIASTILYIFNPELASNRTVLVYIILASFWTFTLLNLLGMEISSWISALGVILGTFLPAFIIVLSSAIWWLTGRPLQIDFSFESFLPDMSSINQLVLFSGVLLSLAGMEMSAVHAKDVENPQRNYPKAIALSTILVLGLSILGVLAIAIVVPKQDISLVAGSMQAFEIFFSAFGIKHLMPVIALLVSIGALGGLSTWIAGPSKGLLAAAQEGDLPPLFRKINKKGMPVTLLLIQGVLVTILTLLFVFMPSVNSAFWFLTVIVSQLYLIMYLILFAAAVYLRYKKPLVFRAFKIPGKKESGMWITAGLGTIGCLLTIFLGFYPPAGIAVENSTYYALSILFWIVLCCAIPSLILLFQKPSWKQRLDHEKKTGELK